MKNLYKSLAIIAIVAIIGFAVSATFTACGNDENGNGGGTREAKTYTGTANDVTYTLKIEDGGSRAVLTPTQGDKYTLTQNANTKKSTGTVTKVVGGVLTLAPQEDPDDEFTATVSGDNITAMSGTITWDDGTANEAPVTLTQPSTGGGGGNWKWTEVANSTFTFIEAIAYGNNGFVAVGWYGLNGGRMAYSSDGASWTAVADTTFGTSDIYAVAYGNNRFVAGGSQGKMAYSDDNGVTWTAVANSTFGTDRITAIAYGNNKFVAVGNSGKMAYSDDNGVSWTAVADSTIWQNGTFSDGSQRYSNIYAIAYGNNRFVAGGQDGKIAYSSDNGVTWKAVADSTIWDYTLGALSGTAGIEGIAYGNNRFVAVGTVGKTAYSADGSSWTAVSDTYRRTANNQAVAYGNNRFVAGGMGDEIFYSDNGASWTAADSKLEDVGNILGIAYGNNRFVAAGVGIAYADW
jgi:hypothetical protein